MAHQPIAIDGAGADGRAEGAGTAEPGLSTDHGGDGASDEEVTAVPSAPPKSSARDKAAVRYRVQKERRLSKPLKSQHWVWKFFMVYAKEALVNIAIWHICEANGDLEDADSIRRGVTHAVSTKVALFKKARGMLMFRDGTNAKGETNMVYNNPLDMWRKRAKEFPYLARLARRVLSIPATQAQSERMFSAAGLTVNKRRGSLDPENVEMLVFLRCNWNAVDKWLKE